MLMFDPRRRVCAADALEHPYFSNCGLAPPEAQQAAVAGGPLSPNSSALFMPTETAAAAASEPDL
jgi:hypothetical protein